MLSIVPIFFFAIGAASALPVDPIISKLDNGLRYQYVQGPDGTLHLVDLWMKVSDLEVAARYDADSQNVYHLFTRRNPTASQVVTIGGDIYATNYEVNSRTIVLLHGWLNSATANSNAVLVPALLSAEDLNIIVVDWSAGAGTINYVAAIANTVSSGEGVARFITWLNNVTNSHSGLMHIIGHSLGGHQAGIIGRNLGGNVGYISALDPAFPGWVTNAHKFQPSDGSYTEVIHTNVGFLGYPTPLGQIDFYPNGGVSMPGCSSQSCSHERSYYYMGESIISGGFTGYQCDSFTDAINGNCTHWTLGMGGLTPKIGMTGSYYLETNAAPPFSKG